MAWHGGKGGVDRWQARTTLLLPHRASSVPLPSCFAKVLSCSRGLSSKRRRPSAARAACRCTRRTGASSGLAAGAQRERRPPGAGVGRRGGRYGRVSIDPSCTWAGLQGSAGGPTVLGAFGGGLPARAPKPRPAPAAPGAGDAAPWLAAPARSSSARTSQGASPRPAAARGAGLLGITNDQILEVLVARPGRRLCGQCRAAGALLPPHWRCAQASAGLQVEQWSHECLAQSGEMLLLQVYAARMRPRRVHKQAAAVLRHVSRSCLRPHRRPLCARAAALEHHRPAVVHPEWHWGIAAALGAGHVSPLFPVCSFEMPAARRGGAGTGPQPASEGQPRGLPCSLGGTA